MVVTTDIATQTFLGNSVQTAFTTSFNPGASNGSDLVVSLSTSSTSGTILTSNLYSVSIGAPAVGELWANSATITYPLSGSPISNTTYLTVSRIVPFTQGTSFANQGNVWPAAVEISDDTLEMQIQQLAARTTQFRGIWATGIYYNYGDIVQDGANGSGTKNYYICQVPNTSGTWTTDLTTNAYWAISVLATVPTGSNSLTLTGDVTASGTLGTSITSTLATVNTNVGQFSGITINGKGLVTAATALTGDVTTSGAAATLATVNSNVGSFTNTNITVDGKGRVTAASSGGAGSSGLVQLATINASTATSAVSFSSSVLTGAYNNYMIKIDSLLSGGNASGLLMNLSTNNGQSYLNSNYASVGNIMSGSNAAFSQSAATSGIDITGKSIMVGTSPAYNSTAAGTINIFTPQVGNLTAAFQCDWTFGSAPFGTFVQGFGLNEAGTASFNNIKFSLTAGTLTGNFHLYGYQN